MCPTCPFRGKWPDCPQPVSDAEVLLLLRSDHIRGPSGWDVGECHDRVGEPCAGYEAAVANETP